MKQTKSDWLTLVYDKANNLAKANVIRFDNRMATTLRKVLSTEELNQDEVVERTQVVINSFFDSIVHTTVGLIAKHANSSEEMEKRVVANVQRWFSAFRAMEKKDANN